MFNDKTVVLILTEAEATVLHSVLRNVGGASPERQAITRISKEMGRKNVPHLCGTDPKFYNPPTKSSIAFVEELSMVYPDRDEQFTWDASKLPAVKDYETVVTFGA